jgi:predicted DNA-binding transcriptional regulator YafY
MSRRTIKKGANWSVERRYEFMEFRLFWQGHINRSDLMEAFGISVQQASKDFANYIEGRKSNLTYDKRLRTYLRGKNFKPRYFQPDAAEYFSQLQAVEQGLVSEAQSWISDFPCYAATPAPARGVDPLILREVLSAIRDQVALKIMYQSMSRPEPSERWIEPHALAFDGFRWHARAFCRNDGVFKDFLLSRIVEVGEQADASSAAENDTDWHSEIILKIRPH